MKNFFFFNNATFSTIFSSENSNSRYKVNTVQSFNNLYRTENLNVLF